MLAVTLIAVLNVASTGSAPSVLDQVTRIHLAQTDAPPPPRLDSPLLADQRSLYELTREYQKLQDERPGLGFPIAFMAIGSAVLVIDALLLIYAVVGLSSLFIPPVYIVLGIIAAGFLVPGIIFLPIRLKKRAESDAQLQDLATLIRIREAQQPLPPRYDNYPPPPPPPPPPPTGLGPAPEPAFVLAAF